MSINVFTNFYLEANKQRREELELCLFKNYNNSHIKLIVIESQERLKFNDFFDAIRNYGDKSGVNIICNSDIYFDDTILLSDKITEKQVYALNRWEWHKDGPSVHYNMLGSSDVWIFRGFPNNINGDFYLGWWGCDGRIGHEITKAGYELFNPSLSIKATHFHSANVRNYDARTNKVDGPYIGAPACSLDNLIPAKSFVASPFETPNTYNVNKYKFICFYNNWHNGDLHVSRGFVKSIIEEVKKKNKNIEFYYCHSNDKSILADLPAKYDIKYLPILNNETHTAYFERDGGLFINTWYGVEQYKHYNKFGISFDCLYEVLKIPSNIIQVDLGSIDVTKLFPDINFDAYNVKNIDLSFMNAKVNVLISNGPVKSGQTSNYPFNPIITKLAETFRNVNFLVTDIEGKKIELKNVFYTRDIIKKTGCDLNENAFISTKCQVIVGRCSGVYTFALNKCNLFDRDCSILCFSDYNEQRQDFWLGKNFSGKISFRGKSDNYKTQNAKLIFDRISSKIRNYL